MRIPLTILSDMERGTTVGDLEGIETCHRKMKHSMIVLFQAEDGIRDYKVTGVQTCALPICAGGGAGGAGPADRQPRPSVRGRRWRIGAPCCWPSTSATPKRSSACSRVSDSSGTGRSEERRVGKECRSRWSPDH